MPSSSSQDSHTTPSPTKPASSTSSTTPTVPFRQVIAERGLYPLVVLVVLNVVDEIDQAALSVFAPNIRDYFGLDRTKLGLIIGVQVSLLVVAAVPLGYVATRVNRAKMLRACAAIWSFFSTLTSAATNVGVFLVARLGSGTGKAAVDPVGKSLLADYYPPAAWNRVFALHNAANPFGNIVGPLMAAGVSVATGYSPTAWRWAFPILTIPTLLTIFLARRMEEPSVQMAKGFMAASMTVTGAPPDLSFVTAVRRIVSIPTFKRQLVGIGVLGFALVGVAAFASLLYEEAFGIGESGRGLIFGILATASLVGNVAGGPIGERIFQKSPALAVRVVGVGIALNTLILAAGVFLPTIYLVVSLQWFAILAIAVIVAPLNAVMSAICPPRLRALMLSLITLCIALFGGILGGLLVGRISDLTNDVRWGLASLAPFGVVGGLLMASGARTVAKDIAALAELDAYGGRTEAGPVGTTADTLTQVERHSKEEAPMETSPTKKVEEIGVEACRAKLDAGAFLLDVRNQDEWDAGHAPQARFLPLPRLRDDTASAVAEIRRWLDEHSAKAGSSEIVVVCRSGQRSLKAAEILVSHGLDAYNLAGGMKAWAAAGLEMVSEGGGEPKVI